MRLKTLELNFPYKRNDEFIRDKMEKGMTAMEAKREDYQTNWKWEAKRFLLATRCMASIVERLMQPIKTDGCWKIGIDCVEEDELEKPIMVGGEYELQFHLKFDDFFALDDSEKKKKTIEIIWDCLHLWEEQIPFDLQNIYTACQKVKEMGYINKINWKKPIRSPKYIAQFEIEHDVQSADFFVSIYDRKRKFIKRELLVSSKPHERDFYKYLGKTEWIAEDEIALYSEDGQVFTCKI